MRPHPRRSAPARGAAERPARPPAHPRGPLGWAVLIASLVAESAALASVQGGCSRPEGPAAPPPPAVTVSQPLEREVIEWDEYTGRLEASETVDLRPRVGGLIESAPFTDGALVHTGQTLFVIDPRPYKADYDKALADVDRAKAQAQQNSEELVRIEKLRPTGAATEKELLDARYNKQAADAALASAKANARTAELNLEWTNVVAPIDGRASRKLVTPGNLVNGGAGQATLLTTIVKFDPIYCYVDADEAAILKYQRLAREHTRVSARDTPIPAYVGLADEQGFPHLGLADFVDNRLTPGTGTLQARATIANPDARLTPGLFARVRVAGSGKYQAMLVVDHAVLSDQGRRYVLVVGANNIADIKPVEPGALFEGLRVVKGLKPDDWVVVNGYQFVRPGQPVAPTKAPMQLRHSLPEDQLDLTRQVPPTQPAATQPTTLPINPPTTQPAGPGTPPLVPPPATSPTTVPAAGGGGVAR